MTCSRRTYTTRPQPNRIVWAAPLLVVFAATLMFFPAAVAEASEICHTGDLIWIKGIAVGCQFKLPENNVVAFLESAFKLCKGTDVAGFSDGKLVCIKIPNYGPEGMRFSKAKIGKTEDTAQPAKLATFDRLDQCEPVRHGALAWWPLDGVSDATAEKVSNNRLQLFDEPVTASGKIDGALRFDRDYAQANEPLDISTGDFSIETWVRTTQSSAIGTLLDQRESHLDPPDRDDYPHLSPSPEVIEVKEHVGFSLFIYQGKPGLQLADGQHSNYVASRSIADGQWHHLAVTVDRDKRDGIRWYVDGAEVLPRQNPTGRRGSLLNTGPLRLGVRSFEKIGFFEGDLDEVLVHGRALAPGEIRMAAESPRCKNAAAQATCEITSIEPTDPREFQAVDFNGFVHPQPGCFYSWTWLVDGKVIANTHSVRSYSDLDQGRHLVCLEVTDNCSPIGCRSCKIVDVGPALPRTGEFCGRSFEEWKDDHKNGKANIIDESNSDRRWITGTNGRDLILGNQQDNRIEGLGGDDCIYGFAGHDSIHGDKTGLTAFISGNDEIHGGDGNDHLQGDAGNDRLFGEAGNDTLEGDSGNDLLSGGAGNDRIHGDSGNDDLRGDEGSDCLKGDSGNDRMDGGPGNDDLKGDSGSDNMTGGPGRDALKGDSGRDQIRGGPGPDLIKGDSSEDSLWGDAGNDRLCGDGRGVKRNRLDGGSGRDGCRSGKKTRCESTPKARDCRTQNWNDWNSKLKCP